MSVSSNYALKALMRGLAQSGVFTVGQMHKVLHELEAAAIVLDQRGRHSDAEEIREMIAFSHNDPADKL
jgi:hypothetical protein